MNKRSFRARLAMGTALAGLAMYGYGPRRAYAGTCTLAIVVGPDSCSGAATAADTTQTFNSTDVVMQDGFGIDTSATGGTALDITNVDGGDPGLIITDDFAADIIGATNGLLATSYDGSLTISLTGSVTGQTQAGISVYNATGDTDITAATVSGGNGGIFALHQGSGAVSITTTGAVTGGGGNGIEVDTGITSSSVTIDAQAGATGDGAGITVAHDGPSATGSVSITASGAVTGTAGDGIYATSGGDTSAMTINVTGTVGGGQQGIGANHDGTGDLFIAVVGDVLGEEAQGIQAVSSGQDMTINVTGAATSNGVDVADDAITAINNGTGLLSVNAGSVAADSGDGVDVTSGVNAGAMSVFVESDVTAGQVGIRADHDGTGNLSITVDGTITADDDGIFADSSVNGDNLIINVAGDVVSNGTSVTDDGISAFTAGAGVLSVDVVGNVTAAGGNGVAVETLSADGLSVSVGGDVSGGVSGIDAYHGGVSTDGGDLSISVGGAVTGGTGYGIYARTNAFSRNMTVEATGPVTGYVDGVRALHLGGFDISVTTGAVTGQTGHGIYAEGQLDAGTLTILATGDVSGNLNGIEAQSLGDGDLSITATGAVSGATGDGIRAGNNVSFGQNLIIDAQGDVSGGDDGIDADNDGEGALIITTGGAVSGTAGYGIYADNSADGTDLTIDAQGDVSGSGNGIAAFNFGTGALSITTGGVVTGAAGEGIDASNSATGTDLTIQADGDVAGATRGVSAVNNGTGDLSVTGGGTIAGGSADGVYASNGAAGGALTIDLQGAVSSGGADDGIDARNSGAGGLSITTAGAVSGGDDGIAAVDSGAGSLSIVTAGDVSGGDDGISATNDGAGDLEVTTLSGTVTGGDDGIIANNSGGALSLAIAGAVTGVGDDGVQAVNSGSGDLSIAATGTISGAGDGISAIDTGVGSVSVATTGDVTGGEDGIEARNNVGGDVVVTTMSGTVTGTGGAGINAYNSATGTDTTIVADGTVSGGTFGVTAVHDGSGSLSISGVGAISGTEFDGVYARNQGTATSMTIELGGPVSGGVDGVEAFNNGTGQLSITTAGSVTGATGVGVGALHYGDAEMTIATGDVSGATFGVYAENNGAGFLSITTAGAVSGGSADGIYATNSAASTDVRVDAQGAVTGGRDGIRVRHDGTGTAQLVVGGSVLGGTGSGIDVESTTGETVIEIGAGGRVGALSDQAIRAGDTGATITNDGTIVGVFTLGGGNDSMTNTAATSVDLRAFADTDGDGIRDTKNIAVASFGGGADSFTNAAGGFVRLLTVEDQDGFTAATDDDTAPVAFNTTGVVGYTPAGVADLSIETAGIERAHLVGLESFTNAGAITMQDAMTGGLGPVAGDVLVITGSETAGVSGGGVFVSDGGSLYLDTVLNDGVVDTTDVLVVDSTAVAGGATAVFIANAGGLGASTDVNDNQVDDEGEGILVVEVLEPGASASDAFTLGAPVIGGTYRYQLMQGSTGGDWYLVSRLASSLAVYEALPQALFTLNRMGSLRDRIGNRVWAADVAGQESEGTQAVRRRAGSDVRSELSGSPSTPEVRTGMVWGRLDGQIRRGVEADVSGFGVGYDVDRWRLQVGMDLLALERSGGDLVVGLTGQLSEADLDLGSEIGGGTVEATQYGFGTAVTWYGHGGLYVDGQLQLGLFQVDLETDEAGRLRSDNDGVGYGLSVEVGKRFALNRGWSLTPQGQLSYGSVDVERFTDAFGADVSMSGADSLTGRLGLAADYERSVADEGRQWRVYTIANLSYQALGSARVRVDDQLVASREDRWHGEVGVGGTHSWADGRYTLFGQVDVGTSLEDFADTYDLTATAGLRLSF